MYSQLTDRRSPLGLFSLKDVKRAVETLRDQEGFKNYLKDLLDPGHTLRRKEGRGGRGETVKLPLMSIAGKYLHKDLTLTTKYATQAYKACDHCIATALTGFLNATYPVMGRQGRVVILPVFEGSTDAGYFSSLFSFNPTFWKQFFDELRRIRLADQLPVRIAAYFIASLFSGDLISAMARAQAGWYLVSMCFAGRPGAPEVRGFYELELTSFIDGLTRLYEAGLPGLSQLRSLMYLLASQGDACSLDSLFMFISSGDLDNLYGFVRGAYSMLERMRLKGERGWKGAYLEFHRYLRDVAETILG